MCLHDNLEAAAVMIRQVMIRQGQRQVAAISLSCANCGVHFAVRAPTLLTGLPEHTPMRDASGSTLLVPIDALPRSAS